MSISRALLLFALVTLLGGCIFRASPAEFFLLEPLAQRFARSAEGADSLVVGLGPIRFPSYLDRNQIVIAETPTRFSLDEERRWAESLESNFTRVLSQDLSARIPTDGILIHPWPRQQAVDYKVTLDVLEFHWDAQGLAHLEARWELFGKEGLRAAKKSSYTVPLARLEDRETGVLALSQTVDALSRDIAEAIRRDRPSSRTTGGR